MAAFTAASAQDVLGDPIGPAVERMLVARGSALSTCSDSSFWKASFAKQPHAVALRFTESWDGLSCDSIVFRYNCGPCLDMHLLELLQDRDHRWFSAGAEVYRDVRRSYSHFTPWKDGRKARVHTLRTITVQRFPGEEPCGNLIMHLTGHSQQVWRGMRKAALPKTE